MGIDSDEAGFAKVKITPHLGSVTDISVEMPHPNGTISVRCKVMQGTLQAEINLPEKTSGNFFWKGKSILLKPGRNSRKI